MMGHDDGDGDALNNQVPVSFIIKLQILAKFNINNS